MPDFQKLLLKIAKILKEVKIPYAITGGYAVAVLGRPRATLDIDVIIKLQETNIPLLAKRLKSISRAGYLEEETMKEASKEGREFNFIHLESGIKIDFWVAGDNSVARLEISRRVAKKINGQLVYFVSPEDLILSKLRWYKKSGSSRHLEDAESVLKISQVDLKYIKKQVRKQSTIKIWQKISKKNLL